MFKGISGFFQMSTSLSAVSQSATGITAQEAVTGNYSFVNVATSGIQIDQSAMFNHNYDASLTSGIFSMSDGHTSIVTTAAGIEISTVSQARTLMSVNFAAYEATQLESRTSQAWAQGKSYTQSIMQSRTAGNMLRGELSDRVAHTQQSMGQTE